MNLEKNMKGEWIWRSFITVLVGIVGWYAASAAAEQKAFNAKVNERVSALELESARNSGNRFTAAEWLAGKNVMDAALANQDKRITRTEDAIIVLKETLPRMEKTLNEINRNQN
jgi:hypothetical protein